MKPSFIVSSAELGLLVLAALVWICTYAAWRARRDPPRGDQPSTPPITDRPSLGEES